MTTSPTPEPSSCFGVLCPYHQRCSKYAAIEAESRGEPIATCFDGDSFPGFVELVPVERVKEQAA